MTAVNPESDRTPALRSLAGELGGLALVWLGDATGYQRYALPATFLLIALDAIRRKHATIGFPPIWFILNSMALCFGLLSISLQGQISPECFGALCALLLAGAFLAGSVARATLIQLLAEQRNTTRYDSETPHLATFFRLYTLAWACFFLLRSGYLLYLDSTPHNHMVSGIILKTTLLAMILVSFQGKLLYRLYAASRH